MSERGKGILANADEFDEHCMNCKAIFRCDTRTKDNFKCQEPFDGDEQ